MRNTKSRRKPVSQVRCGVPEGAVFDLETGVVSLLMVEEERSMRMIEWIEKAGL